MTRNAPHVASQHQHQTGILLVLAGAALWGTMGPAVAKMSALSPVSMVDVSGVRLLVGGLLMFAVAGATGDLRRLRLTGRACSYIFATGCLAATFAAAYFVAVQRIGVATATVITLGAAPSFVVLVSACQRRRLPRPAEACALALAGAGLLLVTDVTASSPAPGGEATVGIVAAVASGIAFGTTTVLNRQRIPGLTSINLIATSFTVGGTLTTLVIIASGRRWPAIDATGEGWAWFAWVVIGPTVLGYILFFGGLQSGLPSTTVSLLTLVEIVVATGIAVVLLGEQMTFLKTIGMVAIVAAAAVSHPAPPRRDASIIGVPHG
ncbi:DMT family transporter [Nocardioides sp.]|uniref:DMT family transporter n=1 Tax=Nocardioides sp. TaxID=35761 RepID=UPI0035AD9209